MSLAGCQINPLDVNFHLQKSLEFFDKDSADKIWSKKEKVGQVPSLMPIKGHLISKCPFGAFKSSPPPPPPQPKKKARIFKDFCHSL